MWIRKKLSPADSPTQSRATWWCCCCCSPASISCTCYRLATATCWIILNWLFLSFRPAGSLIAFFSAQRCELIFRRLIDKIVDWVKFHIHCRWQRHNFSKFLFTERWSGVSRIIICWRVSRMAWQSSSRRDKQAWSFRSLSVRRMFAIWWHNRRLLIALQARVTTFPSCWTVPEKVWTFNLQREPEIWVFVSRQSDQRRNLLGRWEDDGETWCTWRLSRVLWPPAARDWNNSRR